MPSQLSLISSLDPEYLWKQALEHTPKPYNRFNPNRHDLKAKFGNEYLIHIQDLEWLKSKVLEIATEKYTRFKAQKPWRKI